ncbi:LOW QUALITY PROTEIN: uncharacterized protein FYW61_016142 [Anableps anableps]
MASSSPLSQANTTFSLALFRKLSEDNNTANIFFSPFSISSALAMVMLGARGNTATQLSEVILYTEQDTAEQNVEGRVCKLVKFCPQCLKTQDCQDDVHTLFAKLLSELNKPEAPFALSVANRLYGEKSYNFLQEFLTQTRTHYNSELESVDFRTSCEEARVKINSWVEQQTQGKIKELLAEGMVDSTTRMVLVNAIYFKGTWMRTFSREKTYKATFRLSKTVTKPVQMMFQNDCFPLGYISEVRCQILEMPYKGNELSMLIFLPKEINDNTTGLENLEKHLTYEKFMEWTDPDNMKNVEVNVRLPRFKLEEKYELSNILRRMGVVDAFDGTNSDLSGMSGNKELFLSNVLHKAFVEVKEEGTEAAAATAVFVCYGSCLPPIVASFNADHPFLFFIRHNSTKSILFAGRFCSPDITFCKIKNMVAEGTVDNMTRMVLVNALYFRDTMASSSPLSQANTTFSLALFRKLSEDNNTANIFFSPFSISSALAMVMLGSQGNTATQLSECLKTQDCQDDVHTLFAKLLSELNKPEAPFALSVANRLYGEKSYNFLQEFLTQSRTHYNSEMESVDFRTSCEEVRVKINSWVEEQTQGKIKDMVAEGTVNDTTRIVLVNAIYFKGTWNKAFPRSKTYEAQFRLNKKDTKPVQMMEQKTNFNHAPIPEVNCEILEMPYKGMKLSMLIFLPKAIEDDTTGLEKLENLMTYKKFMEWTHPNEMESSELIVRLPRFKMEEKYDLNKVLSSMGMVNAFNESKCDFSGMSSNKGLFLSKVSHKAFAEVNEEGTEAAAATAGLVADSVSFFTADHPFLFFIRHNPTMSILFAGRFCSPETFAEVYFLFDGVCQLVRDKNLRFRLRSSCDPNSFRGTRKERTMAASVPLTSANTTFSLALLRKLGDNDNTANIFFSPFSISSALAMVMLGARGNTAAQMSEVLCFTETDKVKQARPMQMQQQVQCKLPPHLLKTLKTLDVKDDIHSSFAQLLSQLNKSDAPYALSVANRLYGEQSYQFVQDYLENTKKHYQAELETVDFANNFGAARVNINGWVEKQTQGKIKDILGEDAVNGMTRLVLVNAIYFKGNWDKQFKVDATHDAQFRINQNETKPVKMMHQKSKFLLTYISEVNCQVLEMPYKGKELSMLIFLPTNMEGTTGLEKLEQELTYEKFMEWTRPDMMDMVEVQVGLPRFKMEEKYDMKNVLISMGMVDAFDQINSDFSGMSPANNLFVSEVYHKAFVEVNEEGTEAAAATTVVMMLRCAMIPATFVADHPFLFFIRHNPSRSILFAGRYCSPV